MDIIKQSELQKAVHQAIKFLHEQQLPSGEFRSYHSTHPTMESDCQLDSTPFPTALIVYSLGFHNSSKVDEMTSKAIRFFLKHMEKGGVWRYWTYKHSEHKRIPPDVDDTVCVSQVLRHHKIAFPDNRDLLLANRNRENTFYTWFVPRWPPPANLSYWRVALKTLLDPISLYFFWKITQAKPSDVDGAVNANALFYLGVNDTTKPVVDYLIGIVKENREGSCDKWHLSPFNLYYFLSRNFLNDVQLFDGISDEIVARIEKRSNENGSIGNNLLETALACCALINCQSSSPVLERAIDFLLKTQNESGSWQRIAMYYAGPNYGGPEQYFGWGSEELTTGFCIEALSRYSCRQETLQISS